MKKIVSGVVLLLLGGILVAPKFIGDRVHEEYMKNISAYPTGGGGVSLEQKSYEQSWFSSKAVTVIKIPLNEPKIKSMNVVMTSRISHGPVLFTDSGIAFGLAYEKSDITLSGFPAEAQKLVDKYLSEGAITTISRLDFNMVSHDTMHINSIHFEGANGRFDFGGFNLSGESRPDFSMVKGTFKLPASHFVSSNVTMDIADAAGSYDQHKQGENMLGKSDLTFSRVRLAGIKGAAMLEDLQFSSSSGEQSGKLNMTGSIGVRKISAPIPVTAFQYAIEMKHVDPKVLELWSEISRDLKDRSPVSATSLANPKMLKLLELLLQDQAALNQKLTLDGMGGSLNVNWDSHFAGLPNGEHIDDRIDGAKLMKAVELHVGLNADEKALMTTPFAGLMMSYLQQGMLVKQGPKLVSDIKLSNGELTVNGNPLPMKKTQQQGGATSARKPGAAL